MVEGARLLRGWISFAGAILVVAVLYWARPVIVPVLLAGLLTFVLSPLVALLQRGVGKIAAVILIVAFTFAFLSLAGWAVGRQLSTVVQELPSYRENIRQKIRDIREAGKGGSVELLKKTVADIEREIGKGAPAGTPAAPLVVQSNQTAGLLGLPTVVSPYLEPLANAGLVVVLVIFMLLEKEELRNRAIKLLGYGRLTVTTRAFDEAGRRVSRYLLFQSLVNLSFGTGVGVCLYLIGVPYVLLWACSAAVLRFVPYLGAWIGAAGPILVSLAVFDGWVRPFEVLLVFLAMELLTNMILEPFFYAGAAGVSEVGLLVSLAFWTWLWGPVGLLIATPLTVCLVVMGKYLPGLEFLSTAMSDEAALDEDVAFYQRLLAGDEVEAAELLERRIEKDGVEIAYDALMLPALNYAERDRLEGRLSSQEESTLVHATRELLAELEGGAKAEDASEALPGEPVRLLGIPVEGEADALALRMLGHTLPSRMSLHIAQPQTSLSEVVSTLQSGEYQAVCLADLPPSGSSKARYVVKRIRAAAPGVRVLVGRWGPAGFTDEAEERLLRSEAHTVAVSLQETREDLMRLFPPAEEAPSVAAAEGAAVDLGASTRVIQTA